MKPTIDVYEYRGLYGLAWFEDGEEGLRFGESEECEARANPPEDRELAEHWHAYRAAKAAANPVECSSCLLLWESHSAAVVARTAARAAVKVANSDRPWPEWATQALAAGWKAPRGWKP